MLADDDKGGRGLGTPGNLAAARSIASWMDGLGLLAPKSGRMQPFTVTVGVALGTGNELVGHALSADWTPLGFSSSGAFSGEVVFVGYGIRAKDLAYDDYAGIDVKGKVLLAMRYEPGEDDEASPFEGKRPSRYSELRTKAIVAREAGAAALVVVSPAKSSDEADKLPPLRTMGPLSDAGIPVLQVTRAVADAWLAKVGATLADARAAIDGSYKTASRALPGALATGKVDLQRVHAETQNVIGVVPGSGTLAKELVVLGAEAYWGPDGRTVSFQRTPAGGGCDAQYLYDLDTGDVTLASSGKGRTTCGYLDYPAGGSLIYATTEASSPTCPPKPDHSKGYVWAIYDDYDIVRDDLRGGVTTILGSPAYDAEATECSKDGRILFTSTRNGDLDLFVAGPDGSNVRQITNTPGYDGGAFFTADCKRIVWRASRPAGDALVEYQQLLREGLVRPSELELFVMDADGGKVKQLTQHGVASFAPYPTPDGKGVIYSSNVGGNPREFDIWTVSFAGKSERLTAAPGFDGFPMFSPDGKWLLFSSNRANAEGQRDTDLYVARWVR